MSAYLGKLKALVSEQGYDEESKIIVQQLEKELAKAIVDQKLLTVPAVQEYVLYLQQEIERCKEILSEQTLSLTETERIQLFERKEACREFIQFFRPINSVEAKIKSYLDDPISENDNQ
jgi:hypothetical protein